MEERKIEITIDGKVHQVFAGNAALRRYCNAGGSMKDLEGAEQEPVLDGSGKPVLDDKKNPMTKMTSDGAMRYCSTCALLLLANLVEPGKLTVDDIFNGIGSVNELMNAGDEVISGVPWLKNQAAAGSESK